MKKINFENLHKKIKGDFFKLCGANCAGMCERYYLSYYLPGEVEYIAKKLELSSNEFREKYVTILRFKDGSSFNLLRASSPCPFLTDDFKCDLEKKSAKLITCKMYPFCAVWKGRKKIVYLDYHCPLVWNNKLPAKFARQTKKALKELNIPKKWLENAGKLGYFYDYKKLVRLNQKEITYETLQKCLLS